MRQRRFLQILLLCFFLLPGCRPPLKITYDIPGAGQTVYVSAPDYRVATFKGSGEWEVVATVRIGDPSQEKAQFVHKSYKVTEKAVEISLRDFAVDGNAIVPGPYAFYFSVPGSDSEQPISGGVVVLDTIVPRIYWLSKEEGGEKRRQLLSDSSDILVQEESLSLVVEDLAPCELFAGGTQIAPDSEGVYLVALAPFASSAIELEARDKAGLQTVCRPRITWDQKPPELKLPGSPYDVTARARHSFEFEATDDTGMDLLVLRLNEKEVPLQGAPQGRWSAQLQLQEGKNVIVVEAIDKAKRRSRGERTIEYDPSKAKLACRLAGTDTPANAAEPEFVVAILECGDAFEVLVECSFVPSSQAAAGEAAAQKLDRRYQKDGGKLEIPLSDFLPESGLAVDGFYRFRWTVPDKMPPQGLPASAVILDRTAPKLALGSSSAEVFDAQAGEVEAEAAAGVARVRLMDDSLPLRVSAGGAIVTRDPDDMYSIPLGEQPVEVVAVDMLGHKSVWKLRRRTATGAAVTAVAGAAAASVAAGEAAKVVGSTSKASGAPAPAVEPGSLFISVEMEPGRPSRWAVPATVEKIEGVPGERGKFLVTTSREPSVLMVLVGGGAPPVASGDGPPAVEPPFLMDCHEVTVERYKKHRDSVGTPWEGQLADEFNQPEQPVVAVSWEEAREFAAWAGKELPSARQHVAAAVWDGKVLRKFPWGDDFSQGGIELRWQPGPPAVTSLIRDVSPWGVVGLAGGVREWCADEVPGKPEHRAIRGGSVVHPRTPWLPDPPLDPDLFAAAREGSALQASKMNDVGFRCVLRLQAVAEAARAGEPPASDGSGRTEPAVFNGERKE